MRGKWVMEVLLGSPPPPPPPNVPLLEETKGTTDTGATLSVRQRHGAAPQQPAVHLVPPGDRSAGPRPRALRRDRQVPREGWDGGRRRRALSTGPPINGPAGLRAALLRHQDARQLVAASAHRPCAGPPGRGADRCRRCARSFGRRRSEYRMTTPVRPFRHCPEQRVPDGPPARARDLTTQYQDCERTNCVH